MLPSLSPVIFLFPLPLITAHSSPIWLSQNITFPEKGKECTVLPHSAYSFSCSLLFFSVKSEDICKFYWYWYYSVCRACWAPGISHSEWEVENQVKMEMMIFREPGRLPGQSRAEVLHSDTSRRCIKVILQPFIWNWILLILWTTLPLHCIHMNTQRNEQMWTNIKRRMKWPEQQEQHTSTIHSRQPNQLWADSFILAKDAFDAMQKSKEIII